jgi:hypothetical protein
VGIVEHQELHLNGLFAKARNNRYRDVA